MIYCSEYRIIVWTTLTSMSVLLWKISRKYLGTYTHDSISKTPKLDPRQFKFCFWSKVAGIMGLHFLESRFCCHPRSTTIGRVKAQIIAKITKLLETSDMFWIILKPPAPRAHQYFALQAEIVIAKSELEMLTTSQS